MFILIVIKKYEYRKKNQIIEQLIKEFIRRAQVADLRCYLSVLGGYRGSEEDFKKHVLMAHTFDQAVRTGSFSASFN